MNGTDNEPRRFRWRDFVNRREPAALRVLGLLVLLAAAETTLVLWGPVSAGDRLVPAALIPPVVTLIAILASPWWSLPCSPAYPDPRRETPANARRWVWLIAGAVTILAMWPRSARLNHSFSSGEIDQLQTAYRFSRENSSPAADPGIEPNGGRQLVWNHVAAQFAANFLHQTPPQTSPLNERVARTLPWVAGIITVGLVVLLGAALGSTRAGLAAGLILAMNPQHVRWSSEVTDRALLLLWLGAALLCLLAVMRTNRWRWWIALGAAQALLLFGNPDSMIVLLAINGAAAVVFFRSPVSWRDRTAHVLRLVAAVAISAAALSVPFVYVQTGFRESPAVADSWSILFSGVPFSADTADTFGSAVLRAIIDDAPLRGPLLFGLLPLFVLSGLYFMLRQDWRTRFVAAIFLFFALFVPVYNGNGPALFLLPLVMAWAGAGLIRLFPGQSRLIHAPVLIAAVYVFTISPILQRMMRLPLQPLRESAAAAGRGHGNNPAMATFGADADAAAAYIPAVRVIDTPAELNGLADAAYEQENSLMIFHSRNVHQQETWLRITNELEQSGRFHLIKEFPAFAPGDGYRLYQYQPREQIIRLQVKPEEK